MNRSVLSDPESFGIITVVMNFLTFFLEKHELKNMNRKVNCLNSQSHENKMIQVKGANTKVKLWPHHAIRANLTVH